MKQLCVQKMYPGEVPRPTVEISVFADQNVLIIGTPWGSNEALKILNETVREFLSVSIGDQEATSPFAKLPGLSSLENNLRSAVLIANDKIFQRCNKEIYSSSCEAAILHCQNSQFAWVQIGQPHLLLLRENKVFPIQVTFDLSVDYKVSTPLPSRLIGVERAWDLEVRSLILDENDSLILLARSLIPPAFFTQKLAGASSEKIVDILFETAVIENQKAPFWLALLK